MDDKLTHAIKHIREQAELLLMHLGAGAQDTTLKELLARIKQDTDIALHRVEELQRHNRGVVKAKAK